MPEKKLKISIPMVLSAIAKLIDATFYIQYIDSIIFWSTVNIGSFFNMKNPWENLGNKSEIDEQK